MPQIELIRPIRSEYASDLDFIEACGIAAREYNRKMMQAIDRSIAPAPSGPRVGPNKLTAREREIRDRETLHEYLQKHPLMRERYKKIGAAALLEI